MRAKSKTLSYQAAIIALSAVMFSACTTAPATIDTSPDAELTFDGLHPVVGGSMDQAWARADFDLSGYSKVMLQSAGIEFRPGGEKRRMRDIGPAGHYAVTVEQKERFREQMGAAFLDELSKSENFTIVD